MPHLTLYRRDGSCSMVAYIIVQEIGVPFHSVIMGPSASGVGYEGINGTLPRAEWLKINPTGYVPTLSVDGTIITELPAILMYLSSLAPEKHLLGSTDLEKARVAEWTAWLVVSLHEMGFSGLWAPKRFSDDPETWDAIRQKGKKTILESFDRVARWIEGDYAVGDHLTVVDVHLHTFWRWGLQAGLDMRASYPSYADLMRRVERLESVRRVMEEEHEALTF